MSFIQIELASQNWSGKERRKQRVRTNKEMERGWGWGWGRKEEGGGEARDRAC